MRSRLLSFIFFFSSPALALNWWEADRSPLGIAPLPSAEPRAMVQVYAARAFSWRGYFAVHTWIAVKEKSAKEYTVYEVIGFRVERGTPSVHISHRQADSRWFGSDPELLFDLRGEAAEKIIPLIVDAVESYPYPDFYRIWPGPNSNTFVSYVIRNTPGLDVVLPANAIGKDWIGRADLFGGTDAKTGFQFSLFGVLGITLGVQEGIEFNFLGLNFGIDFLKPALKLPFVGRIGMQRRNYSDSDILVK